MVFEKKPKIGIVVGLKSEKRTLSSKYNLFVESGYGKKAYNAAKRVINQNIDLIAEEGKLYIWPSGFTHTHHGIPAVKSFKYILTGWCSYEKNSKT